ncbi:hypothetical protein SAMN05880558_102332 [Aeromonas sp. RU39B]|uniref:hypothetical protein n=1 Tax=Aeromonas sp. RU39B TaxID=1907416 RepID=UPI000956DDEB|nr:hypothetical protein [Aeromonas sp. RU39B]SIQ21244.1 hypothetical protein SAMN05880558_102332 [Aeromonas sp. RU39B]
MPRQALRKPVLVSHIFPRGYDKRHHPRLLLEGRGFAIHGRRVHHWLDWLRPAPLLKVLNISVAGLGLLSRRRFRPGDELRLPSPVSRTALTLLVVRSERDTLNPRLYYTGARWFNPMTVALFREWTDLVALSERSQFQREIVSLPRR